MLGLLLGWPAVTISVVAMIAGLWTKLPALILVAAVLCAPFFLYLAATPRFGLVAAVPVVLQILGAGFLRRGRAALAGGLCAPAVVLSGYVLVITSRA